MQKSSYIPPQITDTALEPLSCLLSASTENYVIDPTDPEFDA